VTVEPVGPLEVVPTYADLNLEEQNLVDKIRILMGDQEQADGSAFLTDDEWAVVYDTVLKDFNSARPRTTFVAGSAPDFIFGPIEYGMLWLGAQTIANQFLGRLPVQGYQGPYVDTSQYYERFSRRAQEMYPIWIKARNRAKMYWMPRGVGTVDRTTYFGQSAVQVPLLRSLPSWQFARGH